MKNLAMAIKAAKLSGLRENVIYKSLSTALTVRDIQTIFIREGIADKYVWKKNKLGHLTAWEKR